jgi:excinuclease ABC subunit B
VRKKVTDILEMIRMRDDGEDGRTTSGRGRGRGRGARGRAPVAERLDLPRDELGRLIQSLTDEMQDAARDLRFEEAARLRDEIHELKRELREVS